MYTLDDLTGISYPDHAFYYLYRMHGQIIHRCEDEAHISYKDYGGRGISYHKAWRYDMKGFALWILNNLGPKPEGLSLDRRNNDGHYEPGNLRWATKSEQTNNRRPLPTNTGESGISEIRRNGHHHFKVSINSKYVGIRSTLADAIKLRDSHACPRP